MPKLMVNYMANYMLITRKCLQRYGFSRFVDLTKVKKRQCRMRLSVSCEMPRYEAMYCSGARCTMAGSVSCSSW